MLRDAGTKHTPGPWMCPHFVDADSSCQCKTVIDGGYAGGIATIHVHNGIALISEGGNDCPPLEEARANARLIAAAPELLAAAGPAITALAFEQEKALERRDGIAFNQITAAKAALIAAIAKAKGGYDNLNIIEGEVVEPADASCPTCGCEVRGQGGYLICECPHPDAIKSRRSAIAKATGAE